MNTSGNTILITGGNTGIGRALAEKFSAKGNQLIITGRSQDKLDETLAANPGMEGYVLDMRDADAINVFSDQIVKKHPDLNILINNAGVGRTEKLTEGSINISTAETAMITNVLGPIRLTLAVLPHLLSKTSATVINIGSGLAHVPLAAMPAYSASKAAIHSWTQSLRFQLKDSSINVIEIIPPAVHTGFLGLDEAAPHEMPLGNFIAEVMEIFADIPDSFEICVKNVLPLRNAEATGNYEQLFRAMNSIL
ncbi:SDR family NAD(P)-dependent oxidoreductase [Pantoea sp.]|uniref:SDR family oxidoreductase n=1 Tax=Pantoea sp. TaxID=69393 RepID=UPI0028A64235|nr:SDR family NAD(P)-dependent oxidoreductase [Pantoea sp.]